MASILAVISATSRAAERSFSGLRRLKTYLRNTMGQHASPSSAVSAPIEIKSLSSVWTRWLTFSDNAIRGGTFSFKYALDNIETVDRIKYANFQLSFFSNDSSFITWENGERLRCIPISEHERIASANSSTTMINKRGKWESPCLIPRSISKLTEIVPLYAYASAIIDNATCYVTLKYIAMTLRGSITQEKQFDAFGLNFRINARMIKRYHINRC